jgi:hypothetical protein
MTSSIGIIARHPTLDFSIGNLMVYSQIPSDSIRFPSSNHLEDDGEYWEATRK